MEHLACKVSLLTQPVASQQVKTVKTAGSERSELGDFNGTRDSSWVSTTRPGSPYPKTRPQRTRRTRSIGNDHHRTRATLRSEPRTATTLRSRKHSDSRTTSVERA